MDLVRDIDVAGKRWDLDVSMDGLTVFIKTYYIEEIRKAMEYYYVCAKKNYNVRSLQNEIGQIGTVTQSIKKVEGDI